jgi:hypothetical protein
MLLRKTPTIRRGPSQIPNWLVILSVSHLGDFHMNENTAYNVYLHGKLVDTVFATGYNVISMRLSLIHHDGYDPKIVVKKARKKKL